MNLLDLFVVLVLGLYIMAGIHRGFLQTVMSLGANIVSWLFGMLFMPLMASAVKGNADMFNMLLYYTEGSEFIGNVELARTSIETISHEQLTGILNDASLPYPFAKEIMQNVEARAFADMNISTLGDYFNQTIVCVVINIISFLIVFAIVRVILAFVINGFDYAVSLPKLRQYNTWISSGFGLVRGVFGLFVIFMAVPLILIVMDFDFIHYVLDTSFFAPFFYYSNFMLGLMPGG